MISVDIKTLLILLVVGIIAYYFGRILRDKYWEAQIEEIRKDAIKRSRAVLGGQFSEQLAPYLPDFPFSPTECRFIGKPVDFIVFKGMDGKTIEEVVFVEVKSGKATLSSSERVLRDVVREKRVSWVEYKVPEELTKKKDQN
ncbi:hypothetical protein HYT55_05130 [Candidatus Woesearchaeota archaeon]|nr:hypothetical protein [Candidatus Woesearchaeota archaeon]